jgi:hypothetical protein
LLSLMSTLLEALAWWVTLEVARVNLEAKAM